MTNFKPGDWVRYKGVAQISHITHTGYHLSNGYITKGDNGEIKLWKPQPGEWCWFWGIFDLVPKLAQFIDVHSKGYHAKTFSANDSSYYSNVEPFIGQLPTILKDT